MPANESVFLKDESNEESRSRFDSYRKRVHNFMAFLTYQRTIVSSEAGLKAALHTFHLLRREDLMPNLRKLWMYPSKFGNMGSLIPFLLTRSLRSISLRGHTPSPDQLFPLVANLCPSTEDLTLGVGPEPSTTAEGTKESIPLEYLCSLKQLRSLTVHADWEAGASVKISSIRKLLERLPHLTKLSLAINHIEHDGVTSLDDDSLIAPLGYFKLTYYPNPSSGLPLLHSLPVITHLTVTVLADFTSQEVASFHSAVALHPNLLSYSMGGDEDDHSLTLDVEDIVPLFSSRTLQCILLDSFTLTHRRNESQHTNGAPVSVVVDIIIVALKEYKGPLAELHLPDVITPIPAFDSLMQFAEYTPWLRELTIPVHVPEGWTSQAQACSDVRFTNSLRDLYIANDYDPFLANDQLHLAKCIDSWFPSLDDVTCYSVINDDLPRFGELWSGLKTARLSATGAQETVASMAEN
ncbi:hypothetical protein BKA70DRAFT_1307751 [Coprinopsis sp. MPI-PUGE-AT-0042]|nr:hypothetical protein BKA70DRAFT_1307751 [Coprinopsis sp. MPI-PUGE-AT-0042]